MNILVVDDSKAMRLIVRRALRQAGYGDEKIMEAACADEALRIAQNQCPDLLLCDWNMPGTSGMDLLQKLRYAGLKTRFGFVTSECTEERREKAAEAGALFLIAKPFTVEVFQGALNSVLRP